MEGKATDDKELGNLAFKEQRYDDAVAHYTTALASSPPDAIHLVLSNRAAALLALSKFEDALRDCEDVVKRSPGFLKGYLRMAQALKSLGRSREALDACKRGLAAAAAAPAGPDAKKPPGYPEITRLAHALNTEMAQRRAAAAAAPAPADSEQAEELMHDYEELAADVENLNGVLERKVRDARRIEVTLASLARLPRSDAEPRTFVPVGRMFLQRPLNAVETDLQARLDRAAKDVELGRGKMAVSEQRLKELSREMEALMARSKQA